MTAAHRFRVWRRAVAIGQVRRRRDRALDSLEPTRPVQWAEFRETATTGETINQRLRVSPIEHDRICAGEWTPRRELLVGGWQ